MKRYTEEEIKYLQKFFHVYDVDVQSPEYQKLKKIINDYIQICRNIDSGWSNVPELEDDEYTDEEFFDFYGDPVRIEWKEKDHCDGWEYYVKNISWSVLWGDWEEDIKLRKEERERKEQEEKEKQKQIKEQHEKAILITLIEKYGLPPFEEK